VRICALLAAGWIAAAAPAIAEAPRPWLARSSLVAAGESQSRGIVFFLRVEAAGPGAAAVGSAAIFDRSELAGAERIEFRAGPAQHLVATSKALLTPPGWTASAGASPRSPHLVYARRPLKKASRCWRRPRSIRLRPARGCACWPSRSTATSRRSASAPSGR
jgi:hypothetical protein